MTPFNSILYLRPPWSRRDLLTAAGAAFSLSACTDPGAPPGAAPENTVTPQIDSHHHFWRYTPADYGWMNDKMKAIQRDFLPPDLQAEIRKVGIDGVVSVQARQNLQETSDLLSYAGQHDFIRGVVGWIPLIDPKVSAELEKLSSNKLLKGVRHVLQDEVDDRYMLREDFNLGISVLKPYGLVYDILIFAKHLPQTIEFVDRHPRQPFVLDHLGKPDLKGGDMTAWREGITELGKRENVACKLSGLATEADWTSWTEEQLRPYMEVALEAFGPDRLMFGSDWPVSLLAITYEKWYGMVQRFLSPLPQDQQAQIMGGNAARVYKL